MCADQVEHQNQAAAPRFSMDECRQVAAAYDGTAQAIDRLMAQWSLIKPGLKRRHITRAAARGGYKPMTIRRPWSLDDEGWLLQNHSKLSDQELAAKLQRPVGAIHQHYRRLRDRAQAPQESKFSLGALRKLTGVDPRDWRDFIRRGWLEAEQRQQDAQTRHPTYVTAKAVRKLLRVHPEVYDYEHASEEARAAFALDQLSEPPGFKQVACRSRSCSRHGGTRFWAAIYEAPNCPQCGRLTSRLSETAQYRNGPGPCMAPAVGEQEDAAKGEEPQGPRQGNQGSSWASTSEQPTAASTPPATRSHTPIAVRLLLCEDQEHRVQVLRGILARHAPVVILVNSQQEARNLKVRLAAPAPRGAGDDAEPRCTVAAGVDQAAPYLPHCVVSADTRGAKALARKALHRLLALLDTRQALYHAVVITREERRRGGDRLEDRLKALRASGVAVLEEAAPSRCSGPPGRRACTVRRAASTPVDPLLALLSCVGQGLKLAS